jgi:hypothetical protein
MFLSGWQLALPVLPPFTLTGRNIEKPSPGVATPSHIMN